MRLLLADLGMPRMDGGELAERAKDLDSSLIAVLMAVPDDPMLGDLLSGYGDLPFVPKPVSFGDLAEKLICAAALVTLEALPQVSVGLATGFH